MSAHAPECPHFFPGRTAVRRKHPRWSICLVLILLVGCRSIGTRSNSAGTASISDDPPSKKNTLIPSNIEDENSSERERAASATKRAFVAKKSSPESGRVVTTASNHEDNDADDEPELNGSSLIRRLTKTDANAQVKVEEPDVTHRLIEIISFKEEVPSDSQNDPKQSKNPRRVPRFDDDTGQTLRLKFPQELPGATAPDLILPSSDDDHPELTKQKIATIDALFPVPAPPKRLMAPAGHSMTLEELEELALQNNPTIVQALASITMAQGTTIQAGVSPNPTLGYESDTVGSSFTRNYQGISMAQLFKTAGKLGLQRATANMDVMNSQLLFERTKLDVLHQVRMGYYNVLVAQEAMKINGALVSFSNQVYGIMVSRLKNDEQAGYELSQLKSLVNQALGAFVASQNTYITAWKQLAVATGVPELPIATLEGRVDMSVPNLDYDALLEWVLNVHPDLHASRNLKTQSQLNLDLQKRIPIPDVTVAGVFQNDFTTPGFGRTSYNLNVSVPLPLYDKNQGNIRNAQGKLNQSAQQYAVTKNALTGQLADAFGRYQTGRVYSEKYRTQILPDMARAYRGVYYRYIDDTPDKVAFGDIIVAQQNLAGGVSAYIGFLLQQWIAATDIANLVQLRNFHELFPEAPSIPGIPAGDLPSPTKTEGVQP